MLALCVRPVAGLSQGQWHKLCIVEAVVPGANLQIVTWCRERSESCCRHRQGVLLKAQVGVAWHLQAASATLDSCCTTWQEGGVICLWFAACQRERTPWRSLMVAAHD